MHLLKMFMIATFIFLLMDSVWLGYLAKDLYINEMGKWLRLENGVIKPNYGAAIVVYSALIVGLMVFVLPKSGGYPLSALAWGALFGFICYATYDFTNLSVVKQWPLRLSIIDTLWGCFICGVTSAVTTWLQRFVV